MNSIPIDHKNLSVAMLIARVIEEARTADSETEAKRGGFLSNDSGKYELVKSLTSRVRCEIHETMPEWDNRYSMLQNEDVLKEESDNNGLSPCWESLNSVCNGELAYWEVFGRLIHKQGTTEWGQVTPELAVKRMVNFAFNYKLTDNSSEFEEVIASAQVDVSKFLTHLAILTRDDVWTSSLSVYQICGASMYGLYDHSYQKLLPCGIIAQVAIAGRIFHETPD